MRDLLMIAQGVLYGVNYEKHEWGIYCYVQSGNMYSITRKYPYSSYDYKITVPYCVIDFKNNVVKGMK